LAGQSHRWAHFPWQVSISVSRIPDPVYAHFCAGTIYSNTWIVTAAHCVEKEFSRDLVIIAGTNRLGIGGASR
jgi:secreted trypsin-like serine protease